MLSWMKSQDHHLKWLNFGRPKFSQGWNFAWLDSRNYAKFAKIREIFFTAMRNDSFLEQRNAVCDYQSGGGIWNSTISGIRNEASFTNGIRCTKLHAEVEWKNEFRIIKGRSRNECKKFLIVEEWNLYSTIITLPSLAPNKCLWISLASPACSTIALLAI